MDMSTTYQGIEMLSENRPPDCEKLTGQHSYRIRQGRYRIVYSIEDQTVTVIIVKIAHRKNVYR